MAKERSEFLEKIDKIFAENQDNQNEELMFTYKGVLYPSRLCSAKTFEALETMEARKDDMLIVTYPKCDTNWTVQILNDIVAARYEDFQEQFILQMLDFGTPEKFQQMKDQPSPRIFSTHLHYNNIPKSFIENKVKNLYEGFKQIADFFDVPLPKEKIQSIAEKTTFGKMSSEAPQRLGGFAPIIFRKGVVGDWKTLFTEAQSQEMDAKFEECLAGTKLGAKLKYDEYCKF